MKLGTNSPHCNSLSSSPRPLTGKLVFKYQGPRDWNKIIVRTNPGKYKKKNARSVLDSPPWCQILLVFLWPRFSFFAAILLKLYDTNAEKVGPSYELEGHSRGCGISTVEISQIYKNSPVGCLLPFWSKLKGCHCAVPNFRTMSDRALVLVAKLAYFMCFTTLLLGWRLKNKYFGLMRVSASDHPPTGWN